MEIKRVGLLAGILFAGFFFLYQGLSYSGNNGIKQQFEQANLLYKENRYPEAIAAYETILRQGFESGNLYYNLANSYFKQGVLGLAILHYERAEQFIPQDSDVQANYDYARSLLNLGAQELSRYWFFKWLDKLFSGITINLLTLILAAAQAGFFLALIVKMQSNTPARIYRAGIVIILAALALGGVALRRKIGFAQRSAIVVANEIGSKFEPLESSTTHFTLTEGSRVEVIETSGGWYKIKRLDNKTGWVERKGIEFVFHGV